MSGVQQTHRSEQRPEAAEVLCRLFAEVLGRESVDPAAGFYDLGGDRPAAERLLARVHAGFGVRLTLPDLADAPTPAALAARLAPGHLAEGQPGGVQIECSSACSHVVHMA
ncbi:acyl carrier protein, partial [Kitasatospora sp. NPDC002543]